VGSPPYSLLRELRTCFLLNGVNSRLTTDWYLRNLKEGMTGSRIKEQFLKWRQTAFQDFVDQRVLPLSPGCRSFARERDGVVLGCVLTGPEGELPTSSGDTQAIMSSHVECAHLY
jgi:hypothetical protein